MVFFMRSDTVTISQTSELVYLSPFVCNFAVKLASVRGVFEIMFTMKVHMVSVLSMRILSVLQRKLC